MPRVLIVDDERPFCRALETHLGGRGFQVTSAHDAASGLGAFARQPAEVVLLDQMLPDARGSDLCEAFLEINERTKIIFITAHPSFDHAVDAIKKGAFDYLTKPVDLREIELGIRRALRTSHLEQTEAVARYRASKQAASARLVGASSGLAAVQELVERAASSRAAVLVTGETGTGKNVVAEAVHYASERRERPFFSLNCAALPASLIEAELFGNVKGAFTGADSARRGVFEIADGGTLLLDEIGSMPVTLQPKLLSVLEEGAVRRIGSDVVRHVDVRVVAATNSDLTEAIRRGEFREDLYYRLNVIRIELPPLRQRRDDLPALAVHLIGQLAGGASGLYLDDAELARLAGYDWPGNVRELRNLLERAIALQEGPALCPSAFLGGRAEPATQASEGGILLLEEVERRHVTQVLAQLGGNLAQTARGLGISLNTLKRKLQRYGVR